MMGAETKRPPVARTTEGQPDTLEAYGPTPFAHRGATGKQQAIPIPRATLEQLVHSTIDLLDSAGGDADSEPGDLAGEHAGREPENGL